MKENQKPYKDQGGQLAETNNETQKWVIQIRFQQIHTPIWRWTPLNTWILWRLLWSALSVWIHWITNNNKKETTREVFDMLFVIGSCGESIWARFTINIYLQGGLVIIVWGEEKQQKRKVKDDSYLSISLLIFRRPREWLRESSERDRSRFVFIFWFDFENKMGWYQKGEMDGWE